MESESSDQVMTTGEQSGMDHNAESGMGQMWPVMYTELLDT